MTRSAAAVEQQLGESAQRIEILDTSVAELNQKIDRLDERVNTIVATTQMNMQTIQATMKASEAKIDRLEASMQSLIASLQQNQAHTTSIDLGEPSQINSRVQQPVQVTNPNLERNRENIELGYRPVDRSEENRKGLYKKVEMPTFAGQNPFDWIARAERYFRVTQSNEDYKMELVSLSLSEDALCWFNYELEFRPFREWNEFKRRLLSRFAESFERTPGKRLFGIQQHGSAAEYIKEFQELASQVRVAEENLIDIFFNGLKQELKEVIKMKEPRTLPDHIETILKMEDSEFCRLLAAGKSQEQRGGRYSSNSTTKPSATYIASSWKPKQTNADTGQKQVEKQAQPKMNEKNNNPIKLSDAEYDYKRRNGLCFKCPEKWSKTHLCKNKTLQVMVVCQDCEMELIEEEFHQALDGGEVTEIMEISLHSFLGQSSPTTTKIRGSIGKTGVVVLIDSGATHNFISPEVVQRANLQSVSQGNFTVLVGTGLQVQGSSVYKNVSLQLQEVQITQDFIVLEPGSADIILGIQWLRTLGKCEVDWEEKVLSFNTSLGRVTLRGDVDVQTTEQKLSSDEEGLEWDGNMFKLFMAAVSEPTIPMEIVDILEEYKEVFAEPTGLPPVRGFEHSIRFWEGTKPMSVQPYRYPHVQMEAIETMVKQMLDAGLIRNSRSPFSSPVLLVKKKDGGWRFCVDYRAVNKATIPDKFPIPVIDQLLDELNGAVIFSKLDLRSGYHQIRMTEAHIEKTAFRTHEGQYEFVVMPFGLSNAPATFQALMNEIFKPFLRKFVLVFFDDILVYSNSIEEHKIHLQAVIQTLIDHQLYVNKKKCLFGQTQVEYLGHIISVAGVATDPSKISAMKNWPTPRSVKELRSFLGLTGYYRRFVKAYGIIARPLTDLLKIENFDWTGLSQKAFEGLKTAMVTAPVLALPDFSIPFVVESDASGYGLGAVLMQNQRPIAYFSKGLSDREQLKPIYERELMAIVLAVQKWKHYLMGRKFIVHTDQKSLKFLLDQRDVSLDYQKLLTKLLGYDFEIIYKAGCENKVADGLSRVMIDRQVNTDGVLCALTVSSSVQMQNILDELDENEDILRVIMEVLLGKLPKVGYTVAAGRLFYKGRLVLSRSSQFIQQILREYHDGVMGGHSGILKTIKRIQQGFYWPKMKVDVKKYVAECSVCQQHKYSTLKPAGLLQPIELPKLIWSKVSMDFIEGLPKSEGANVILVVVDRLSKYAHFLSLKQPFTATTVAEKFVKEIVHLHGYPTSIIFDRDRIFLSKFWRECFRLAGTTLKFSTAYHPQSDGQTEVLNRCLESYLRCFTSDHPKQ